ncbi:hypothetical protein RJ639_025832 [Escallonia herrerae]|uniref:UV-stimulated scaffold protein A C-terminal domain-containing protein n=1 Tax=Escallonia herrerae TaxID=1293975 RepID=A0AA88RV40_9ASTE|nr:hypothetical protein RJ639_025832 [Escallonia herrerae]
MKWNGVTCCSVGEHLKELKKNVSLRVFVRYFALLIIDELFMLSKLFRTLLIESLDQLLTLSVGFRRNLPLPGPPAVASVLRSKAIEFLEKWNDAFGIHYRQLGLRFDYLKNTLRYQFPYLQANAARIQQERREREREMKTKQILVNKFETLKARYSTIKDEIQSTIDGIGECLDIISGKDKNMPFALLDDEEMEEFRSLELRQIRLDSFKEGEIVHEDSENKVVFDALRELYKLLVTKHMVIVQDWISVLIRVEASENRVRDSTLKEFIDLQNSSKSVKRKREESGCALSNTAKDEEEDIWEEGTVGSLENEKSGISNKQSEDLATVSTSSDTRNEAHACSDEGSKSNGELDRVLGETESDPLRSKLLAEAPSMKWGSFLGHWGSDWDVLANQRAWSLKIIGRRDLRVCPFHGPIIPRDDQGKPIDQSSKMEEMVPDLGTNLVEELVKQAVKNVREEDTEEGRKREHDKQALKRAKLAKVREHNECVLRDAAIAATSRSSAIGEDTDTSSGNRSSARNKRQTLASMLKKKVTSKDRLVQRLLNTHAKDATTRQLTLGEDATVGIGF